MSTLRVIYVHGISDSLPEKYDYTNGFTTRLLDRLKEIGVVPANAATQAEIDKIITFEPAYYADIGHEEEEGLVQAYEEERDKLYNFADKTLDRLGYDLACRFMISSLSDVLLYKSQAAQDLIRNRLFDKIKPYVGTSDPVTIVAHSLGTVVAFDVLYYHNWHTWPGVFKPSNLFTLGSPIALFSLSLDAGGKQETKMDPDVPLPDPYLTQEDGVWYNFLDAQDLIGYPLELYFQKKYVLKDILVQTGTLPIKAHTEYWQNNEVLHHLADRLKTDYNRIKS